MLVHFISLGGSPHADATESPAPLGWSAGTLTLLHTRRVRRAGAKEIQAKKTRIPLNPSFRNLNFHRFLGVEVGQRNTSATTPLGLPCRHVEAAGHFLRPRGHDRMVFFLDRPSVPWPLVFFTTASSFTERVRLSGGLPLAVPQDLVGRCG